MADYDSQNFGIYILGAGFSCAASMPLAKELWMEVRRRAERMSGRASKFKDDLETYLEYRKDCDGIHLHPDEVNFEEFLGFLDIEHSLGLRGSDTWSKHGNEGQVVVKTLIGQILSERMPSYENIPEIYLKFARKLRPNDVIITFNYDTLLESALEVTQTPFRLFPDRYKSVSEYFAESDNSCAEVIVLKVHGSIDWFDGTGYQCAIKAWREAGSKNYPPDKIFHPKEGLSITPITDGPRFPNDSQREIYRLLEYKKFYNDPTFFLNTPVLVTPSTNKILSFRDLGDFWNGMGKVGYLNFRMAIIGFSLAPHDEYSRQIIYRMVKNYQNNGWDREVIPGKFKTPLLLVDFRKSEKEREEFNQRYSFTNKERTKVFLNGFNEDVLKYIN